MGDESTGFPGGGVCMYALDAPSALLSYGGPPDRDLGDRSSSVDVLADLSLGLKVGLCLGYLIQ